VRGEREMRTRRLGFMALMAVGLVAGWVGTGAAIGPTRADWCEATKLTAAGLKASCLAVQEAKGVLGGTPRPDRCDAAFTKAFAKAEAIAGAGVCPTEGDAAAIEAQVDACVADIAATLSGSPPPSPCQQQLPATGQTTSYTAGDDGDIEAGATLSYTSNADGTITDNNTGLVWEKKTTTCGGDIHCVDDDTYTWDTAFTGFIDLLNDVANSGVSCFAGHCDWRLPNIKELQSIVNYENVNPAVSPAFNDCANGSCTAASTYWSSTTYALIPAGAWNVNFFDGFVDAIDKAVDFSVRAVRGGL